MAKEKKPSYSDYIVMHFVTVALRNQSRRFFAFTQTYNDLQGRGSRLEVILPCPFLFFAVSMICTS